MIIAGLGALQASQAEAIPAQAAKNLYLGNMKNVDKAVTRFIVNFAMINAIAYCHHTNRDFTPPRDDLGYVGNLMLMMGHVDPSTGLPDTKHVNRVERLWTLVAV
jgi:citrate synthase